MWYSNSVLASNKKWWSGEEMEVGQAAWEGGGGGVLLMLGIRAWDGAGLRKVSRLDKKKKLKYFSVK